MNNDKRKFKRFDAYMSIKYSGLDNTTPKGTAAGLPRRWITGQLVWNMLSHHSDIHRFPARGGHPTIDQTRDIREYPVHNRRYHDTPHHATQHDRGPERVAASSWTRLAPRFFILKPEMMRPSPLQGSSTEG